MLKDIQHFSTHSVRKTFGRKIVEMAGDNSEMALIKLGEIYIQPRKPLHHQKISMIKAAGAERGV